MFPGDLLVKRIWWYILSSASLWNTYPSSIPQYCVYVTKHKDAEPHSAAAANSMNLSDPIISPRIYAGNQLALLDQDPDMRRHPLNLPY